MKTVLISLFALNTGKRTIRVRNVEHSAQSAAAARELADRVRKHLGVQDRAEG